VLIRVNSWFTASGNRSMRGSALPLWRFMG